VAAAEPRQQSRDALIGERARTVVGERAQAARGRQQFREHEVRARPARLVCEPQREVVELVEHRHRRPPDVAGAGARGDERPQRLRAARRLGRRVDVDRRDRAQSRPRGGRIDKGARPF
jgi:hypothetical protein